MNTYRYADIKIGHAEQFSVEITGDMMASFLSITQDTNPLHNDEEFAIAQNFPQRVVYGMLTASLFSTLAGVYLPGRYSLIQRVEADFPNPVFVGDVLTVSGVVKDKSDAFNTLELRTTITNQDGKKVCRGKMRIGVTE